MGTDCSLFIFPHGKLPRETILSPRYSKAIAIIERLGTDGFPGETVPAHRMLAALSPELEEAAEALRHAIVRWGADVPVMIHPEDFDSSFYAPRPVMARLERRRSYADRKREAQAQLDGALTLAEFKEWRSARHKNQYAE